MHIIQKHLILLFSLVCIISCATSIKPVASPSVESLIPQVTTPKELDQKAVFSFAIMSDNKGDGPETRKECERMVTWIRESGDAFIIGMGDHVKRGWRNDFLEFIKKDPLWQNHFYPGTADGENEFYGKDQGDWGAAKAIFEEVNLKSHKEVAIAPNGVDYVAHIPIKNYTVHWIQAHFPDTPEDPVLAFPQTTRDFIIKALNEIKKGSRDIIIVGAHSITGSWIELMTPDERKVIMDKADLVLAATTHFFERQEVEGYGDTGALCVNTGSITYPTAYCPGGYSQIHVLEKPLRLVVQYVNAEREQRELQMKRYAWLKVINGGIASIPFREMRTEEDIDRAIGFSIRAITPDELTSLMQRASMTILPGDVSLFGVMDGIKAGNITVKNLWELCPFNNLVCSVTLTQEQWKSISKKPIPEGVTKDPFVVVIDNYSLASVQKRLQLSDTAIKESKKSEHDLLMMAITMAGGRLTLPAQHE